MDGLYPVAHAWPAVGGRGGYASTSSSAAGPGVAGLEVAALGVVCAAARVARRVPVPRRPGSASVVHRGVLCRGGIRLPRTARPPSVARTRLAAAVAGVQRLAGFCPGLAGGVVAPLR